MDQDSENVTLLSKKQKEKLRKQRQKQKQKTETELQNSLELENELLDSLKIENDLDIIDQKPKKTEPTISKRQREEELFLQQIAAAKAEAEARARRIMEEEEKRAEEEAAKKEAQRLEEERQQLKQSKPISLAKSEAQIRARKKLEIQLAAGAQVQGLLSKESTSRRKFVKPQKRKEWAKEQEKEIVDQEKKIDDQEQEIVDQEKEIVDQEKEIVDQKKEIVDQKPEGAVIKESWDDTSEEEDVPEPNKNIHKDKTPKNSIQKDNNDKNSILKDNAPKNNIHKDNAPKNNIHKDNNDKKNILKDNNDKNNILKDNNDKNNIQKDNNDLRSPICCILGHVDTGKTKLLDKIRQTNVQEGEAGGITQQIGATYFPIDAIRAKTKSNADYRVPGLLVIDTPGHESFANLRSRGSSLCNIAILVVDIMHGLEQQTLESIQLLRQRKTPFVVALNKIDLIYGWKRVPHDSFSNALARQEKRVVLEFEEKLAEIKTRFAELSINSELFCRNKKLGKFVSIIPTSAVSGEGIPDLLHMLVDLTQSRMGEQLAFAGELEATVLEVKVVEGLGTTIDVILSNGILNEGDKIVVCGLDGAIVTNIRALLTPQPMRELRVKSQYVHHKSIKAAMGIKICAQNLDNAVAGSRLAVLRPCDDEEKVKQQVMADLENLLSSVDKSGQGVWVQASTLGSLEALLVFLKESKIPVFGINIGPVHRRDVVRASVMLQHAKEFAVMLCFDVKIEPAAQDFADDIGVTIFRADIIYHLYDKFNDYYKNLIELKRKEAAPIAIFPCLLQIVPRAVFNSRDPIILGVNVIDGILRVGTPICVVQQTPDKLVLPLGKVTSMEINHKPVQVVKKGTNGVAIKIECAAYETPKMFGRHFKQDSELLSLISRQSIDALKENFRQDLSTDDWKLVVKLKKILEII